MSRTVRTPLLDRSLREPRPSRRRTGTRDAVIAAALAEYAEAPTRGPVRAARSAFDGL